jgi:hypothetical protein
VRKRVTVALVGCVATVAIAATVDALHPRGSSSAPTADRPQTTSEKEGTGTAPKTTASATIPRCAQRQLALDIEIRDLVDAVLRHVGGELCREPNLRVKVHILTRDGQGKGLLLGPEGRLGGLYYSGVENVVAFRYSPVCGEQGAFRARVEAGPYAAQSRIPVLKCGMSIPRDPGGDACTTPTLCWSRKVALEAGFMIAGSTGSAWIVEGGKHSFYFWGRGRTSASALRAEGYRVVRRVAGVEILSDGVRLAWRLRQATVWVEAGPTEDAIAPKAGELGGLIAASKRLASG